MRKQMLSVILALIICGIIGCTACAQQDEPALSASVLDMQPIDEGILRIEGSVDRPDMVVPEEVQLRLTVENVGKSFVGNVRICRDSGAVISEMGNFPSGSEPQFFTETITPTDTQLDDGAITYLVRYRLGKGKAAEEKEQFVQVRLNKLPAQPGVEFTRSLPITSAKKGEEAVIAYRVKNTGNVTLTNIRVTDELCGDVGMLERLDPGVQQTFIYRFTMEETAASKPVLTYSHRASRETFEKELGEAAIYLANEQLDITLEADQSALSPGGTVTLTYRIINNGDVAYDKLRLSDQGLGELANISSELRPGQEYVFTKTVTLKNTTTFLFVLEGQSEGGTPLEAASNPLTVAVTPAVQAAALSLSAEPDKRCLSSPGEVTFSVRVHNAGEQDVRDVSLAEREHGTFWHLAVAAPGDTVVAKSYWVEKPETFAFTVDLTDAEGGRLSVLASPVEITFDQSGEQGGSPETRQAIDSIQGAPAYQLDENPATYTRMVISVLALLLIVGISMLSATVSNRRRKRRQRDRHLRRLRRDYQREMQEDERQRTRPLVPVKTDTTERANRAFLLDAMKRRPGSRSSRSDKGGK